MVERESTYTTHGARRQHSPITQTQTHLLQAHVELVAVLPDLHVHQLVEHRPKFKHVPNIGVVYVCLRLRVCI